MVSTSGDLIKMTTTTVVFPLISSIVSCPSIPLSAYTLTYPWVLYFLGLAIYNVYFHPLRSFPGPRFLAACALPRVLARFRGDDVFYIHKLHQQYGEIVRVGPTELSFINSKAWKDLYGHVPPGKPTLIKDPLSYGKPPNGSPGMFTAPDGSHTRQRRVFSPAFSDRALKEQEPLFWQYVELLINQLHEQVQKKSSDDSSSSSSSSSNASPPVNLVDMYNFTTFDIMADLTFGESLQLLQGSRYNEWVRGTFDALKAIGLISTLKFYFPTLVYLLQYLLPPRFARQHDNHFRYAAERVDRRLQRKTERPDIWQLVLPKETDAADEKKDVEMRLSLKEMHNNASTFMMAGSETTATLLSGVTYYLLMNPAKMERLVREIRTAFASKEDMTLQRLPQLPYLNACLEEALRIYPPVAVGLPRLTPKEGWTVCGQHVPGNVTIYLTQWAAYHSPLNFARPDDFVPERWLEGPDADPEFANDDKHALQPFSIGPRNCLGKNLAYHEMRLILGHVLWHFDLELCEESRNWADQRIWFLWSKPPLMARLKPVVRS